MFIDQIIILNECSGTLPGHKSRNEKTLNKRVRERVTHAFLSPVGTGAYRNVNYDYGHYVGLAKKNKKITRILK